MSTNSQEIVHQVRAEFEAMLTFVLKATPQTVPDADSMERSLFQRLFALGCLLLRLYFVQQDTLLASESVVDPEGVAVPWHSHKARTYLSIFGDVRFARRYYYRKGEGHAPLDAALNLPACGASDLLREWREKLCAYVPYHQVVHIMAELLHHSVSTRQLQHDILEDARHVAAYYAHATAPPPVAEASILVMQGDGKGVPLRQSTEAAHKVRKSKGEKASRKKEALVTSVYTVAPLVRTPQQVVASLFEGEKAAAPAGEKAAAPAGEKAAPAGEKAAPRPALHNKRVFATLEGKETALAFTAAQVWQQYGPHICHKVALTDGSDALQQRVLAQFPDFTLVLDCIHAIEYLWKAANAVLGETNPQRTAWVQTRTLWLLSGQTQPLIDDLQTLAATAEAAVSKTLLGVAAYYDRNQAYMHYEHYLAAGWPIATGVIEGACRHLVKDRCELSGMRWTQAGAEALLQLRAVAENGEWEAFHVFRRTQRQSQLYGKNVPSQPQVELRLAA